MIPSIVHNDEFTRFSLHLGCGSMREIRLRCSSIGRISWHGSFRRALWTMVVNKKLESSVKGGTLWNWHGKAHSLAMRTESICTITCHE